MTYCFEEKFYKVVEKLNIVTFLSALFLDSDICLTLFLYFVQKLIVNCFDNVNVRLILVLALVFVLMFYDHCVAHFQCVSWCCLVLRFAHLCYSGLGGKVLKSGSDALIHY